MNRYEITGPYGNPRDEVYKIIASGNNRELVVEYDPYYYAEQRGYYGGAFTSWSEIMSAIDEVLKTIETDIKERTEVLNNLWGVSVVKLIVEGNIVSRRKIFGENWDEVGVAND